MAARLCADHLVKDEPSGSVSAELVIDLNARQGTTSWPGFGEVHTGSGEWLCGQQGQVSETQSDSACAEAILQNGPM